MVTLGIAKGEKMRIEEYCWERNAVIWTKGAENALFGYIEDYMDFRYAPNHENCICSIYEIGEQWIVDFGKDKKRFKNKSIAIEWVNNIMGVSSIRNIDFQLYDAPNFCLDEILIELKKQAENAYEILQKTFDLHGFRYNPVQLIDYLSSFFCRDEEVDVLERMGDYLEELFERVEDEVRYSAWLYGIPTEEGNYMVCRFDGLIHSVNISSIEKGGEVVLIVNETGKKSYDLTKENGCEQWIWAHDYSDNL
ncbi:hypothetical protein OH966_000870 [Vibrio parahaemolyticus]|nr:hypothetical protein M634_03895 [Vibrio parahaemolyticus O1:Kuk str. FDA_R31]EJB0394735.1 hypothetical protein [Vibrio parahaemolyticus]EJB5287909.1 hypothetical protein [Vibrio parahaemolyticus]EJZ3820077.1 hypothetical protein [Vibrio parahaemolyticus]ODW64313.1 hypothetical protein BBL90_16555 [Vibrio parahaemolyticus]